MKSENIKIHFFSKFFAEKAGNPLGGFWNGEIEDRSRHFVPRLVAALTFDCPVSSN